MSLATDPTPKRLRELYFIRHGETEWSLSGRHTGRTEIPLTPHGEDQARDVGAGLRNLRFSQVLTSPRQRARYTCELAGLTPSTESDPDLAEWDYGEYEGQMTKVALFSHAQFGCVLAARWIGLPVIEGQHFLLGPASANILSYNPKHPEISVIALLNGVP